MQAATDTSTTQNVDAGEIKKFEDLAHRWWDSNSEFKPLHDRVLIEVLDSSEKTAGGIIIPDSAQEKPQEGKVVAVGGGSKTEDGKIIPMDVKVGDKVLFGKWSGTEVKIDGKEYSIMKESDIMGISTSK